ncbi:hypothetical protein CEXT_16231 [Caerostris extrusa]|uniref:Uncharacterized protein n=1 Tax=Caerostris extrusa TaxID=172846 RepID=A0AAV4NEG5_CAEEX|nr:hypothetical protein CEXT_16231 [Caerostris extrusa]
MIMYKSAFRSNGYLQLRHIVQKWNGLEMNLSKRDKTYPAIQKSILSKRGKWSEEFIETRQNLSSDPEEHIIKKREWSEEFIETETKLNQRSRRVSKK